MSIGERETLIARIRQLRRRGAAAGKPLDGASATPEQDVVGALDRRLTHLEHLVQGLQDSVHREGTRQEKRIARLETRIESAEHAQHP